MYTRSFQGERRHIMKKTLLKKCQKPIANNQKEKSQLISGREMFDKREPKRDVPMYSVRGGRIVK